MQKVRVAINGFGRIGRTFFRLALESDDVEVVAINDLADRGNLAYLLQYDTVYGRFPYSVTMNTETGNLEIQNPKSGTGIEKIPFLHEKNPEQLPWEQHDVDIALESTGVFTSYAGSRKHLAAGAKRVVVSAPVKDEPLEDLDGATVLMGVNDDALATCDISSNASCTTNAGSPLIAILREELGIEKALLNTVHGYTASQDLVDSPNEKWRRGRAAAQNIVPSSTGSAIATTKAITELSDKFDGIAVRVPVAVGSLVDVTFLASRETTIEEVNGILRDAAQQERWRDVFQATDEPIVSSDIIGSTYGSIADLSFTRVVDGNLVKVMAWYDNEMGYASTLLSHVVRSGRHVK